MQILIEYLAETMIIASTLTPYRRDALDHSSWAALRRYYGVTTDSI